jgi:hypothetical protein
VVLVGCNVSLRPYAIGYGDWNGPMAKIVKAPGNYDTQGKFSVFLAGTIDMGRGENWQQRVGEFLSSFPDWLLILDPRRDDWDDSWEQDKDNPEFAQQVKWELKSQEVADLIVFVFATDEKNAEKAKAPITLMELGLFKSKECVVCCPQGYEKKGNVDIVCERYGVPLYEDFDAMLEDVAQTIAESEPGS